MGGEARTGFGESMLLARKCQSQKDRRPDDSGVYDTQRALYVKTRDDRSVVRRPFQLAWRLVDVTRATLLSERGRGEDQVDAQARVATEGHHPVVPPRIRFLGLFEQPEAIREPGAQQRLQRRAFGRAHVYRTFPGFGVVHVAVFRRDVEIAQHDEVRMARPFRSDVLTQRVEPAQLVGKLVRADRLAVRHVDVDDAQAPERSRQHAPLFVIEARNARDDVGGGIAAEDGDAVVSALSAERGIPAEGLQVGCGKIGIAG